jgi:hypothetical protein
MGESGEKRFNPAALVIPARFSVISNPEGFLDTLNELVSLRNVRGQLTEIFFDHSQMVEYDLAAEQALDTIAADYKTAFRYRKLRVRFRGIYPTNPRIARFLRAIGIVRQLGTRRDQIDPSEREVLEVFVAHRRKSDEEIVFASSDKKSRETRKFVDHINNCLARFGRQLSHEGIERLATYAGEILANAEEHSGRGEWLLAGYLDGATEDHMCEIAILSFGNTFADTFLALPQDSYPLRQIDPYLKAHLDKGFFSTKWRLRDLITLVALQGGISCKNASEKDTRGKGTIDLISFFEQMHQECAQGSQTPCEMAILSGKTHMRFDGTYRLKRDSTDRDVIAFNKTNSLEDAPDPNYVRRLDRDFPGTIISIRFSLQPDLTQSTIVESAA